MPMTWNSEADVRLFCTILKVQEIKIDFPAVAAAMGDNVTPKALVHRIAKLKSVAKEAEASGSVSDNGGVPVDGPTTPITKRARGGAKKEAGAAKEPRGRKKAADKGGAATDGGEKKKRTRVKKSVAVIIEQVESQGSQQVAEDAGSDVDDDDVKHGRKTKRVKKENIPTAVNFEDGEDEEE